MSRRVVKSTTLSLSYAGDEMENIPVKGAGDTVVGSWTLRVRVVTPRDARSWARAVVLNGLVGRITVLAIVGRHPVSRKPRAIDVSVRCSEATIEKLRLMRICRDETQGKDYGKRKPQAGFQNSTVARFAPGSGAEKKRPRFGVKFDYMTPKEREEYVSRGITEAAFGSESAEFLRVLHGTAGDTVESLREKQIDYLTRGS